MAVKKATKTKKKPAKKVVAKKASPKKPVTKKVTKAKKTIQKKVLKTKPKASIANNKSKIAPYKVKKNEKYMSAAMKKHFIAVLLLWKEHLKDEMQKTFENSIGVFSFSFPPHIVPSQLNIFTPVGTAITIVDKPKPA